MTRTLRGRLALWHLSMLAATLVLFAALGYAVLSRSLYRHHDDELAQRAGELVQALGTSPLTQARFRDALLGTAGGSRFVMVRDNRGELLYRDPVLASSEPDIGRQEALVHAARSGSPTALFFTVDLEQSTDVRFICVPLGKSGTYLQIGDPLGDVQAMLRTVANTCLLLIPAVLVLSSLGSWTIARRTLAPVRSVTTALDEIEAADLSRRVHVHPADQELEALVATLNRLLDRLQRSFETLREFAGDLSHQIQTPLTIIKGALESALRQPERMRDPGWLAGIGDEVEDIRAIVTNLRSLALADAPIAGVESVDLTEIVAEASDIVAALGELRQVAVHSTVEAGVTVHGDATRLKQMVLNLGDNAVKYTPPGGRVTIRLEAVAHTAILRVIDTGIGIPEAHLPRLFDRLFRTKAAGEGVAGMGLGLAIVKRIVEAHRGTIEVHSRPGAGSSFAVTLPRC